jgi:glucan phosphoethanolaminetransferase (alkaline phosphatase superfamily)
MNFQNIKNEIDKERKEKPNMKILIYWAFISALGIILIRTVIRPKHYHLSEALIFLQGTLPNFFAGAMFCVLAFVYYKALYKNDNSLLRRFTFAFLFSFFGLTLWEYIQYLMGYPIDYFDILMSGIGNMFTIIIILLLRIK